MRWRSPPAAVSRSSCSAARRSDFGPRLLRDERFAFVARRFELGVERDDALAKAFEMRVGRARLFHQRRNLGKHLFTRQSAALAVLIEHAKARFCRIAFGGQRRSSLAQFGAVRVDRALPLLRATDFVANPRQLRFELLTFFVAPFALGLVALVLALELARPCGARMQIGSRCTSGF